MLAVLQRSDTNLFKFVSYNDVLSVAAKLSEGHCFEISLLAMIRVDREQFLQAISAYHLSNDWYRLDLEHIMNCWLKCLDSLRDEEGSESTEPTEPTEPKDQSPEPGNIDIEEETLPSRVEADQLENQEMLHTLTERREETALPDCLAYCPAADAPLATALRKQLKETLGPDTTQTVIAKLRYRTLKQRGKW